MLYRLAKLESKIAANDPEDAKRRGPCVHHEEAWPSRSDPASQSTTIPIKLFFFNVANENLCHAQMSA